MKTIKTTFIIGLAIASFVSILTLSGCTAVDHALLTPTVTPASTNAVTGVVTPAVTTYAPNPTVATVLTTGATYAPLAPAPWGWIASGALALATAGLGLYAKVRNGQLNDSQSIVQAVVSGVEAAGTSAAPVKASIQNAAAAAGVQSLLDPIVQAVSAQMK